MSWAGRVGEGHLSTGRQLTVTGHGDAKDKMFRVFKDCVGEVEGTWEVHKKDRRSIRDMPVMQC